MVIPLLNCIYITYHSIESYWTNSYYSQSYTFDWVGQFFLFAKWVDSNFKKVTQRWWGLMFPWMKMIFCQNHININTMEKSNRGIPFIGGQEMHVSTLKVLIHLCNLPSSLVVTMNSFIGMSSWLLSTSLKQ